MVPGTPPTEPSRVVLQGIGVDALDLPSLLDRVAGWVDARVRRTIGYVNVHVLNVAAEDPELTRFLAGLDLCYADGKGVVLGARLTGQRLPGRMTGADWIYDLGTLAAAKGWRIGWLGGEPGVTDLAAQVLVGRCPGLLVAGTWDGYFPREGPEHDALLAEIAARRLDLLLVGMGTPIQERWVASTRDRLEVPVVWCLGATADFVSGKVDRGPKWLHQNHEWLARLITEPGRLWRRYLLGNPRFLSRMIAARLRGLA